MSYNIVATETGAVLDTLPEGPALTERLYHFRTILGARYVAWVAA